MKREPHPFAMRGCVQMGFRGYRPTQADLAVGFLQVAAAFADGKPVPVGVARNYWDPITGITLDVSKRNEGYSPYYQPLETVAATPDPISMTDFPGTEWGFLNSTPDSASVEGHTLAIAVCRGGAYVVGGIRWRFAYESKSFPAPEYSLDASFDKEMKDAIDRYFTFYPKLREIWTGRIPK
ncbi:MAG: hypothetical protein AB1646_23305 [Thermodesulfobacteriota bacterium]